MKSQQLAFDVRTAPEAMSAEQSLVLAEFARACKSAVRSVSLYPATHPAIVASLTRVVSAAARLTEAGSVTVTVHPDALLIGGRAPARIDASVGELAVLLHERMVGALGIERDADAEDWRVLLLQFARAPEDVIADGGLAKAWAGSGRSHFEIREIDYAEVLRERGAGERAEWDRIIAHCLQRDGTPLDDRALTSLVDALGDAGSFGELLDTLQQAPAAAGTPVGARAAALLQLMRSALDAAAARGADATERALQTVATASGRLTPEMLLAVLAKRQSGSPDEAQLASAIAGRMTDDTIATFVAESVTTTRGATERLAQAFEALVPEAARKERLLDLAREEAQQTEIGRESGFDGMWQEAADMLLSYSDQSYVSDDYGRELSGARTRALDVERVADDPPDRVQAWVSSVSDVAVRQLDLALLLDLLRLEEDTAQWQAIATIAAAEVERQTLLGSASDAQQLVEGITREVGPDGRPELRQAAEGLIEKLAAGSLVRHMVLHLRKVPDADVESLKLLAHAVGPRIARSLAEALSVEENGRAINRLRELLLGFGPAGRQSVEQLKHSSNPAVRRTAIDLLRVFGGREALPELASMLGDADPQVQRESIRAIVQIGTTEAYAVLERALVAGGASRDTVVQQLIGLRDDKAIPLLCYVLNHTQPRGKIAQVHAEIIDALGGLGAHPESTRTLKDALHRGDWWAPFRTSVLRRAAATALRRIGSPDTVAVLQEAAARGRRGVRTIARPHAAAAARRERERA